MDKAERQMQEFVARRCWSKNAAHTPEDTYRKAKGKKDATAVFCRDFAAELRTCLALRLARRAWLDNMCSMSKFVLHTSVENVAVARN